MIGTGYMDTPVAELTNTQLTQEALRASYESGYHAGSSRDYSDKEEAAISRRDECFAEIARRLAKIEALVTKVDKKLASAALAAWEGGKGGNP